MDSSLDLGQTALDHLWLHFTDMGGYDDPADLQVIVKGDGCYLEDAAGKRYLDALAGLFCVNIGYGYGEEMGEAAAAQMRELPFAINWTFAHPRSIELAAEIAEPRAWRPQPRLLRLGRLRGRRGGLEARPPVPLRPRRAPLEGHRAPRRLPRHHHGRALDHRLHRPAHALRAARPGRPARRQHQPLPPPEGETEEEFTAFLLDDLAAAIEQAGPDTVAMVIMEPVQNSGGAFMPPAGYFEGVRAICDEHGILLCADEVITGFGRTGYWFASERFDIRPDLITSAKGLSSAYASIGALIASERVMEPFTKPGAMYTHGMTFGGHPVQAAVALKNIEIMKRDGHRRRRARRTRPPSAAALEPLLDLPIAGDLRGCGYFYALELVKDKASRQSFDEAGVRGAAARLRLPRAVQARPDLPRRRPRRPGRPDLPAAGGGAGGVRGDRVHPRRRARGGRRADARGGVTPL